MMHRRKQNSHLILFRDKANPSQTQSTAVTDVAVGYRREWAATPLHTGC